MLQIDAIAVGVTEQMVLRRFLKVTVSFWNVSTANNNKRTARKYGPLFAVQKDNDVTTHNEMFAHILQTMPGTAC